MFLGIFEIECVFDVFLGVKSVGLEPVGVDAFRLEPRRVLVELELEGFASGHVSGELVDELLAVDKEVNRDVRALSHVWWKVLVFCLILMQALENKLNGPA